MEGMENNTRVSVKKDPAVFFAYGKNVIIIACDIKTTL
jgi:hypothetical protein